MKGRLMTGISSASGHPNTFEMSIETPVTPPSMKWLDSRKPFNPNAAERMTSAMSPMSIAACVWRFMRPRIDGASRGLQRRARARGYGARDVQGAPVLFHTHFVLLSHFRINHRDTETRLIA